MRSLLAFGLVALVAAPAPAAIDPEAKTPYQLRVIVRTGDHPALTKHFRADVKKSVGSALQTGLGGLGTVEVIDLNETPADQLDPLARLAGEKGLEALETVSVTAPAKTHFVFVDFADSKYEIRSRQHDGTTGFVTPIIRKTVHADRGFVGRLAGLAIAQDFGIVGTFDPPGAAAPPQVGVVFKAGDLGPLEGWVKKGDVLAVMQMRQLRRPAPRPTPKAKAKAKGDEEPPAGPLVVGTRLDGVLLHVLDGPRNGVATCKLYNRYRGPLPVDATTVGYRCVRLGTTEGPLKLQLVDNAGTPYRGDILQPRAGAEDFPEGAREHEEMTYADGVFTSKQPFKNVAFVLVKNGEAPVARIPVEIFADQLAVRKVNLNVQDEEGRYFQSLVADMRERILSARVTQARSFDDLANLQKKDKPKALEYGQSAYDSLDKETSALRGDLNRLKTRIGTDAPAGLFEACETDLRTLEQKTNELRVHLGRLKNVIALEKDPGAAGNRKGLEGILLDAQLFLQSLDYDQAIAKFEEALKQPELDATQKADIEKTLERLKKEWEIKDEDHAAARAFVYQKWAKLEQPPDIRDALAEARKATDKCKAVGDKVTLLKFYSVTPALLDRFEKNLRKMIEDAGDDPDKLNALKDYTKVVEDVTQLFTSVGKEVGADRAKE